MGNRPFELDAIGEIFRTPALPQSVQIQAIAHTEAVYRSLQLSEQAREQLRFLGRWGDEFAARFARDKADMRAADVAQLRRGPLTDRYGAPGRRRSIAGTAICVDS